MKLNSFVASYSPDSSKNTNKHNYFMNGIVKEIINVNCCGDVCETANMRSLFAVADGSKSESQGSDAAFLCMDMMNEVYGADFQIAYKQYFAEANRIVQSRSFHANGAKMHMDLGVVYVYRDWARAYNFGGVSIFHKSEEGLKELSGTAPESIKVDRVVKKNGEHIIKKMVKKNTPHIGYISEDYAVIPHISERVRLGVSDCIIIVSESVLSILNKNEILKVLNDDSIPVEKKASAIVGLVSEKNPQGNYTVQLIAKKQRQPINKLKVGMTALILAVIISLFCVFALPNMDNVVNDFLQGLIKRMYLIDDSPELEPWTTMEKEEKSENKPETKPEKKEDKQSAETENKAEAKPSKSTQQKPSTPSIKPTVTKPAPVPEPENSEKPKDEAETDIETTEGNLDDTMETPTQTPEVTPPQSEPTEKPTEQETQDIPVNIDQNLKDIISTW